MTTNKLVSKEDSKRLVDTLTYFLENMELIEAISKKYCVDDMRFQDVPFEDPTDLETCMKLINKVEEIITN